MNKKYSENIAPNPVQKGKDLTNFRIALQIDYKLLRITKCFLNSIHLKIAYKFKMLLQKFQTLVKIIFDLFLCGSVSKL